MTRPARSGWFESMPVSTTPTMTPAPVKPAAQAAGAPICGTLSLRLTRRIASSHSFGPGVPGRAAPPPADADAVNERQNAPAEDLATWNAAPPGTLRIGAALSAVRAAARAVVADAAVVAGPSISTGTSL